MQMGDRDRVKRRDLQERMYEERAAKIAEMEYVRKVEEEKKRNAVLL